MSTLAIESLLMTLQERLRSALAAAGMPANVHIGAPDDDAATSADLTITLVRVAPNESQLNRPPPQPGAARAHGAPLDLHLLFAAGDGGSSGLATLGRVIQALADAPLVGPDATHSREVRLLMEGSSTAEVSEIWSMFRGTSHRPSVLYLASPVWVESATGQDADRQVR